MKATIKAVVVKVNENNILAMGIENGTELYSIGIKILKMLNLKRTRNFNIF